MDTATLKRSVFVLPADFVKGKRAPVLVLNDCAQALLEQVRGQHRRYVFTRQDRLTHCPLRQAMGSGWKTARRRASERYEGQFGVAAPEGFQRVRLHDLRHTFGRRLRAAGVGLEDRQDLLGHKRQEITTHYSAAEVGQLITSANRVLANDKPASKTLLRIVATLPTQPQCTSRNGRQPTNYLINRVVARHSHKTPAHT